MAAGPPTRKQQARPLISAPSARPPITTPPGAKVEEGVVGFVNVKTDYRVRATIRALVQPGDLNRRSPHDRGACGRRPFSAFRRRLYCAFCGEPTRGWGPQKIAPAPGSVSMVISAEPSIATNISKLRPALGT